MTKYNFQVNATITGFIQRECDNDEEAEEIKEQLESNDSWELSELIRGAEVDLEDTEVLNYGENEE